ncbi:MAG: hypothetical protein GY696_00135, partial [Gammaproteobacteria bacterium]|nr:hypothetical protein [Gammaproteobacteria bacterium]
MLLTSTTKLCNSSDPAKVKIANAQMFFDCGSQRSFISHSMAQKLRLDSLEEEQLTLYTFSAEKAQYKDSYVVEFEILQRDGQKKKICGNALKHLSCTQERLPLEKKDMEYIQNSCDESFLADSLPKEGKLFSPDVIIG